MSFQKVTYVDKSTAIKAKNLNDIQDAIIRNEEEIDELKSKLDSISVFDEENF